MSDPLIRGQTILDQLLGFKREYEKLKEHIETTKGSTQQRDTWLALLKRVYHTKYAILYIKRNIGRGKYLNSTDWVALENVLWTERYILSNKIKAIAQIRKDKKAI